MYLAPLQYDNKSRETAFLAFSRLKTIKLLIFWQYQDTIFFFRYIILKYTGEELEGESDFLWN